MARPQELQPRPLDDQPQFVEVIDRSGRVGISEDDTWRVGWKVRNRTVWHKHQDVWKLFRQNERVIQRFLGIPLNAEEEQESKNDPSFDTSLPNLNSTLFILGETQKAQELSRSIASVMSLSVNHRTPAHIIKEQLNRLRDKFGPNIRNELKLMARQKLSDASNSTNIADMQILSLEAFDATILRAREGMNIVSSLLVRGAYIVNWVDVQENTIEVLRNAVGAALREIIIAGESGRSVSDATFESWQSRFGGPTDILKRSFAIRGNPYAETVNRSQIKRLGNLQNAIEQRNIGLIQRILEGAYPTLDQVLKDRKDREASGLFDRYRTGRLLTS